MTINKDIFDTIYHPPVLASDDLAVLRLLEKQKEQLRPYTQNEPKRWWGTLRRVSSARATQGSNSIEGYFASLDEIRAIGERATPEPDRRETWDAVAGYRRAMTYLVRTAQEGRVGFDMRFLKSVHYMMLEHELNKNPGQWRQRPIYITNKQGEVVYEGVEASEISRLMQALVQSVLQPLDTTPLAVRAAMAHLNLVMIHPFSDGNGRMARALQTFILAREADLHPVFSSIEEWLGANTEQYYQILEQMSDGHWKPETDTAPWVRFCLKAHYQQMQKVLERIDHLGKFADEIEAWVHRKNLPERCIIPLLNTAQGYSLTRQRYEADASIGAATAQRDLSLLVAADFLAASGEKRGRRYVASDSLGALYAQTRPKKKIIDPYELLAEDSSRLL